MTYSSIDGTIPSELGSLKTSDGSAIEKMYFYIADQYVSGTVPTQIGGMAMDAVTANFSSNFLTGPLPTQIGRLSNAAIYSGTLHGNFNHNYLCDDIPTEIAALTAGKPRAARPPRSAPPQPTIDAAFPNPHLRSLLNPIPPRNAP